MNKKLYFSFFKLKKKLINDDYLFYSGSKNISGKNDLYTKYSYLFDSKEAENLLLKDNIKNDRLARLHHKFLCNYLLHFIDFEITKLNTDGFETHLAELKILEKLGFKCKREFIEFVYSLDLIELSEYFTVLVKEMIEIYKSKNESEYLNSFYAFDEYFSEEKMLYKIKGGLSKMGILIYRSNNLKFEFMKSSSSNTSSFCAALNIPSDIRIVLHKKNGHLLYSSVLHELGHALQFMYQTPELSKEYKYFPQIKEGYSLLFESLLRNKYFLRENIFNYDEELIHDFTKMKNYWDLKNIIIHIVSFIFTLKADNVKDLNSLGKLFKGTVKEFEVPELFTKSELEYFDSSYKNLSYLTGLVFQFFLSNILEEKFGNNWCINKKTGKFLFKLWNDDCTLNEVELIEKYSTTNFDKDLLIKYFTNNIS
jgi:hypothetical protein